MERMLTLKEVADLLQVDVAAVQALIDSGRLASVSIGGAVRVQPADVEECVASLTGDQERKALWKALNDPRVWARTMDPEFKAKILAEAYEPGTMGAFLKAAAEADDAKAAAGNVIDLPSGPKRGPSTKG